MALTDTRPDVSSSGQGPTTAVQSGTLERFLGSVDHKPVGRMFVGGGMLFVLAGLVLGLVAAFESADGSGFQIARDADEFTQLWSLSRDLTVFGGLVPILLGIGLYIVPLQIGAPSLAFARGASGAFWTWLLGSGLLVVAYLLNGGPGGGRRDFVVLWACALAMMIGAVVWASVVLATTVLGARTVGMTMDRVPFTSWAFFLFALQAIFSLPITMAELLYGVLNVRYLHLSIENSEALSAVVDGVSLAPSVFWLALPGLGIAADVIGAHTEIPVRQHRLVLAALTLFEILTFGADLVGLGSLRDLDFNNGLLVVGLLALPLPILAVLALSGNSLRQGRLKPRAALFGSLMAGMLALVAAGANLLGLVEPIMGFLDNLFPDAIDMTATLVVDGTTFHEGIRALIVGSALLAVISGLYHWAPKFWGRTLPEPMGSLAVLLAAGGALVWAVGEILAGIGDQPMYPVSAETSGSLQVFGWLSLLGIAGLVAAAAIVGAAVTGAASSRKPAG
ncbi:MAG: cbb3-type cytochrome c oxidase subunit I, partial [Acidimicrobiia bacterium]|nr:cbb3-type cytochrome c oxidase subunit I [Acidimicrobiia bacterium]